MHRLHELVEEGEPIYVRNLSGSDPDGITKLIMLQIKPLNGPERAVRIPPIKYPINLSAMVSPPTVLGESQDLLDLILKGSLELVEPETAVKELSDPKASRVVQKALRDVYNRSAVPDMRKKSRQPAGARGEQRKVPKLNLEGDESGPLNPMQKMMQAAAEGLDFEPGDIVLSKSDQEVGSRIVQMCATLNAEPGMADSIIDDLDAMPDSDLSDEDLGHLVRHAKAAKVVEWAQVRLAERSGEEEGDEEEEPAQPKKSRRKKRRR